jgi:hypothetical protein
LNRKQIKRLIEALEIRKKQLLAHPKNLRYPIHDGHHLRDIISVLAVLNGESSAQALLRNLPTKLDLPRE